MQGQKNLYAYNVLPYTPNTHYVIVLVDVSVKSWNEV